MANELAIIREENIRSIISTAPYAYEVNKEKKDRCTDAGMKLLNEIAQQGMSDDLDMKAASYIEKTRKTLKVMNDNRSSVTKLFDEVRKAYTNIENSIDPTKSDSPAYKIQLYRNEYAARKRQEEQRRLQEEQRRQQHERDKQLCQDDIYNSLMQAYDREVNVAIAELRQIEDSITLENIEEKAKMIEVFSRSFPGVNVGQDVHVLRSLSHQEFDEIVKRLTDEQNPKFAELYSVVIGNTKQSILDRLPSLRASLEKVATAKAEEAEQMKARLEEARKREAEAVDAERRRKEDEERAQREDQRRQAEMSSLFNEQAVLHTYQPKTKVTKKIELLNIEGIMPIICMWWRYEGCKMSIDELTKLFKKQISFCEKLANKDGELIQDESVCYVDDVKAK